MELREQGRGEGVSVGSITTSSLDNNCSMDLLTFYDDADPDTDRETSRERELQIYPTIDKVHAPQDETFLLVIR